MKRILMIGLAVALTAGLASASTVTAPNVTITQGQSATVDILVSGGDAVAGTSLIIAIGDGGATVGGTTGSGAPILTAASIIGAGTIFAPNNTGQVGTSDGVSMGNAYPDRIGIENTSTSSGTVAASGVLAHVTILADLPGQYALNLGSDLLGSYTAVMNASGGDTVTSRIAGVITVVPIPEPAALALLALGGLFIRRR